MNYVRMEPAATGHSEKTFSYVVRAPSSEGFDVMNVDVKIDTSWVFQDAEDSSEEQGHLPEGVARGSPDVDTGTLRRQLESSEQKLLAAVDKYVMSESGLRSRIQELEQSERKLLRKVDQLSARVGQERSASLRAQEQLEVLRGELASQDALGCVQDEWLLLPQEELLAACGNPGWQTPVHSHGAPGPRASAGQPTEGPCPRGSVGAGRGPSVLVPGLETTAGLLGDLAGPHHGQPGPAEPSLHEQILLVICGCPSGQCAAGSLLPAELAWVSAQRPPAAPAPEPFLLVQTSTFPPWDPAGDTAVLLLQETSPEDLQTQQVPDARPLPAPRARGQPCWDHHRTRGRDAPLCQESPQTLPHRFPGTGPRDLDDPWKEGGGALALSPEVWGMRRTRDRKEEDLGDGCQRGQESQEDPSLEGSAGALEGLQDPHGALGSPAAASCPQPRRARPLPLLQGAASVSTEDPESLSRTRPAEEHVGGLLGGLSWEEEGAPSAAFFRAHGAKGPSPPGAQLLPEQDGATGRVQGQEDNHAWSEHARLPLEGGPGDGGPGKEEKASHPEGSSLGSRGWEARETLSLAEEGGLPLSPRFALSPEGAEPARPPRAPRKGRVRSALTIDAFAEEMEACFRLLSTLKLGSGGRGQGAPAEGGDRSFAGRRHSGQGHAGPRQGLDTCPAKEADPEESCEDVSPGETEALGTGQVISGLGPDLGDLCLGPRGASEWGQDLHQPPRALERARRRFRQLVSGLKEERSRVLHENAQLQRDQERCHRKMRALQTERQRTANRISALEQDNGALLGDISRLRRELDQYLQVIADLEDCNGKSYSKISELEEDNERLRGCLGQLQRAMSQSTRKCRGLVQDAAQENRELKALISELGLSYKELIKDVVLGIEEMIGALRGQNAHLLRRIQVLEREVAVRMSTDAGRLRGAEEHPQGKGKEDKVGTVERAVQVTPLSDQLTVGVHGPPLEKETGLARGWMGPSSGAENPRCQAETAAPSLVGRSADVSGALQGDIDGTGVREARLGKGEERPQLSEDRGPAPRSPSSGPQLWDPEAESSEEDLQLHVRRLRHQVLTLQCQLRDQGSAGRALQEARDEALCLRDRLEGQVDELQRKQREANLAVTPLKAKLASLVQKCRDRNRLLTRLLRELCRHGAADHLLSEAVHSMVNDVALAEYAAAFLAPGVPETSHHADTEPEKTAAVRAQKCLLNPEMDSVLPRPWHSESWPVTEAEWPAQTARLDALELPLPSGPAPDPGPCGAASGLPAERLEGRGGTPCPALLADSPPPPPGLLSPARILAFHRELGRSVRDSRASQSPLEL